MEKVHRLENFHILLWLLKDLSWLMGWKSLGVFMILPTVSFAIFIAWNTRLSQLYFWPNVAVVFWISANAFWMCCEFFSPLANFEFLAAIPFGLGLAAIIYHIIHLNKLENRKLF